MISSVVLLLSVLGSSQASKFSSEANILQFDNVGYEGYYYPVTQIEALSDGNCSCSKDLAHPFTFQGPLAPLNEELTVHFRGPINLKKFGFYVTSSYEFGQTNGTWERLAYYDSESKTANNVTFLANYGHENTCLGNAADYVTSNGLKKANQSEILDDVLIPSALEFAITSDIKCSGYDDCDAYRTDGQAYHGFYGVNKMFLFEFNAPSDISENNKINKTDGYDMPAIWLLNSHILRTSQYPLNGNCSSWNTGSGEFDIFETMNYTERNHFYSTIHDYQGTDDIGTGLQNFGYLERTPNATMKGGVIFSEDRSITVFLSNDTSLDSSIDNTNISSWLSILENEKQVDKFLSSITMIPPTLASNGNVIQTGATTKITNTKHSSSTTASSSKSTSSVSSISSTSHKNDAAAFSNSSTFTSILTFFIGLLSFF
jgi:hypothetical protein